MNPDRCVCEHFIIDIPEKRYFCFTDSNRYTINISIYNYQNQFVQKIYTPYGNIINLLYLSKFDCFFCFECKYFSEIRLSIYRKNNFSYELVRKSEFIQFFSFMNNQFLNKNKKYYPHQDYNYNIVFCKNKIIYDNNKYLNELEFEDKEENVIEIKREKKIDKPKLRYEYLTKRNEIIFWEIKNNKDNKDNNDNDKQILNFFIYSP